LSKIFIKIFLFFLLLLIFTSAFAQDYSHAERLISILGCSNCHTTLNIESIVKNKIPNLSYAGLRYNSAYLFDFLQNPITVRRHINVSKMPILHFDSKEALALVLYLETQNQLKEFWPNYPSELINPSAISQSEAAQGRFKILAVEDSVCITCHTLDGKGGYFAVDLSTVGYRLQAGWMKKYLASPDLFDVPPTTMTEIFYHLSSDKRRLIRLRSNAAREINYLVEHLVTFNQEKKQLLETTYQNVKTSNPEITAELGEKIFINQNCIACHNHNNLQLSSQPVAPDLTIEGFRVYEEWLWQFLRKPFPVRPFGYFPGTGSRMPDFSLSDGMIQTLLGYLKNQLRNVDPQLTVYLPQHLSAFSMKKSFQLLQDKLSCLGCHSIGKLGGKIGPDLSELHQRVKPVYLYNQVDNPQQISPGTVMPKVAMPNKTLRLIVDFLFQQGEQREDSTYFFLIDNPIHVNNQNENVEGNYLKYCTMCHGPAGGGDGFNAKFLPVQPTVHQDKVYMSNRPDDTLFDGIYAGGYILNKSQYMPPWGFTLRRNEIKDLVAHIRKLCNCEGPEWSLDNK